MSSFEISNENYSVSKAVAALESEVRQLRYEVVYLREQNKRLREKLGPKHIENADVPDLICGNCYNAHPCHCTTTL